MINHTFRLLLIHLWERRSQCWSGDNAILMHTHEEKPWTSAKDSKMLNYPLHSCFCCSLFPQINSWILPEFKLPPFVVLPLFLMSCLALMRGTCVCPTIFTLLVYFSACVFVRLLYIWPSFQLPFLELCFVRCLVSWLLYAGGLILSVDLELIASGWSSFFEVCLHSDFEHNELTPWLKCSAISRPASSNPASLCVHSWWTCSVGLPVKFHLRFFLFCGQRAFGTILC